jgi:hypothetical protein
MKIFRASYTLAYYVEESVSTVKKLSVEAPVDAEFWLHAFWWKTIWPKDIWPTLNILDGAINQGKKY